MRKKPGEIPSLPGAELGFKRSMALATPEGVKVISFIVVLSELAREGRGNVSRVKTEQKYSFKMDAVSSHGMSFPMSSVSLGIFDALLGATVRQNFLGLSFNIFKRSRLKKLALHFFTSLLYALAHSR